VLHVTGITPAISASAAAAVDRAIDIAIAAGVTVSFDVNHRSALWSQSRAAAVYRSIAARASVVFAGEDEARILVDGDDAESLARALVALGPSQAVVKLGAEGCLALVDGQVHRAAAIPVDVVDTVGAGDAFVAGYLAELCAQSSVETRLDTAVRCGAFACLGEGDWESFATRESLRLLDGGDPVIR
jgi:2-dehydro-3-deoxygluconokinase